MDNLKYKLATPKLMWVIVAAGAAVLWFTVPQGRLFYSGVLGLAVLVLGMINWLYVGLASGRVHRKAVSSVQNIDQLVTEGTYAVVRHPMYAAGMAAAWCVFVWHPTYQILAIVIWLTIVLLFWSNLEERMLEEKFLEDYREYKKRVPMFIPRFTRRNH
jgi:methanethiol S-methyltransferase